MTSLDEFIVCGVRPIDADVIDVVIDYHTDRPQTYQQAHIWFSRIIPINNRTILENNKEILNPNNDFIYEVRIRAENAISIIYSMRSFVIYVKPDMDRTYYSPIPIIISKALWKKIEESVESILFH